MEKNQVYDHEAPFIRIFPKLSLFLIVSMATLPVGAYLNNLFLLVYGTVCFVTLALVSSLWPDVWDLYIEIKMGRCLDNPKYVLIEDDIKLFKLYDITDMVEVLVFKTQTMGTIVLCRFENDEDQVLFNVVSA